MLSILTALTLACSQTGNPKMDYPIVPVEFHRVQITPGFWHGRIETASRVTIPYSFSKCEETGRISNFIFAAGIRQGQFSGRFGFDDSDVYKIMEGAAYSLMLEPNPEMETYLDTLISYIRGAQEEDGYLYTAWTLKARDYIENACCMYSDEGKWAGTFGSSHEMYNAGHMYEAAVAHYLATGKHDFIDIATRNVDLVYDVCITKGNDYAPGHQEIEIGLVKLYRATGDHKYLELARHLLDIRGSLAVDTEYRQAHKPVTEQDEAVGHVVRANYMYAAMADIAALTGDRGYLDAVDRIWDNVVSKKLSVTGGLGATRSGEGYGKNYELPNDPYNETCAAIANVYWNQRMFLLHGDSKYIDVLERTLYNGLISGLSLEGNTFFYPNTLRCDGHTPFNQGSVERAPWFNCSCCPSNLSRFIPSVGSYIYAQKNSDVYINLFVNSRTGLPVGKDRLEISQTSRYPWEGLIRIDIHNARPVEANIRIRVPGWTMNRPVPSDLFTCLNPPATRPAILVNGEPEDYITEMGYAVLAGRWRAGDRIELKLPMEVRQVIAHDSVEAKRGLTAFEYGPIVYCAEGIDHDGHVLEISPLTGQSMNVFYRPDLLDGINVIEGKAVLPGSKKETVTDLKLIPYYAWNHRGAGEMTVWFPRSGSRTYRNRILPRPGGK
jgi:DUF1680 family protein